MATFDISFNSACLIRPVSFRMHIPNDASDSDMSTMKTVFLLHGYTGGMGSWVPEYLMQKYNFAVVTLNGENAFYLDGAATGSKYCTYVGEELLNYIRKTFGLAKSAEDTYIMGMSMGGFGSIHTALTYPESFGKVGAMSSALIVHNIDGMKPGTADGMANYEYYTQCFGDLNNVVSSVNNPETLIKNLISAGKKLPEMYLCCGTEDFLIEENRAFNKFLCDNKVDHIYIESKGSHDMVFWDEYTLKIIDWMFGN